MVIPIELALLPGTQLSLALALEIKLFSTEILEAIIPSSVNLWAINNKFVD